MVNKKKGTEQTAYAAVPIEEGMDCFKLRMSEACVNEWSQSIVVQKPFQVFESTVHFGDWRWDKSCPGNRSIRRSDPILRFAELTRKPAATTGLL
jgi:hypothetical protein